MLSRNLEKSLHRALACASGRRHEYATIEHLLLALSEDQDAVAVLRACGVELDRLRRDVLSYVDNELANLVAAHGDDAKPTASFQRVLQRAAIHVQCSGREEVTGANVLVAMFAERENHAVYCLQEQGMTRFDAVNYISHGVAKGDFIDGEIQQNPLLERRERAVGENTQGNHVSARETATLSHTLREHLLEQIGADFGDEGDRVIGLHLLDLLDKDGYLRASLDGVARLLGCGKDRVEGVLARLQQFDPPGVFARDLRECLTLQLRDRNRFDPAMQALLDHLPLLAARNVAALVRVCRVDAEDVAEMISEIKALDPRPGLAF